MANETKALTTQDHRETRAVAKYQSVRNDLIDRLVRTRHVVHRVGEGHTNRAIVGGFTPDGAKLLTASWDCTAMIWDIATGLPEGRFVGHEGRIQSMSLTSDGKFMVTGSDDETARVWDIATQRCLHVFRCHRGGVDCVYVTPDDRHLITGGRDTVAVLWDLSTRLPACQYRGHTDNVSSACLTRDGKMAVTGSYDGTIRIWQRLSGQPVGLFRAERCVNGVSVTPDGCILAAYANNDVRMWSLDGTCLKTFRIHQSARLRIAPERNDAPAKSRGYVNSFNVTERATLMTMANSCACVVAAEHEPCYFSTGWDRTCRQGDYEGRQIKCFEGHEEPVESVVIAPDGKTIATGGWDGQCRLWEIATGKNTRVLRACTLPVAGIAVSHDNRFLVTVGRRLTTVWDLRTGQARHRLHGHTDGVNGVSCSPNGCFALTAGSDGAALLWNMDSGQREGIFEHGAAVNKTAFSPDMKWLATGGLDGNATVFDPRTRLPLRRIEENVRGLSDLAFTPDSKRIVLASGDHSACLCDVQSGRRLLRMAHPDEVRCLSLSPDGSLLATGCLNGEIRVWDLRGGNALLTAMAHRNGVHAVQFSPDGERLFSAGADHLVRMWLWRRGRCIAAGQGHVDEVTALAIAYSGTRLFSGSMDHTVRCWDVPVADSSVQDGKIENLRLVASLHHLEDGFLWTTPPTPDEHADSGWFWTDRPELIRVERQAEGGITETLSQDRERKEYFAVYCRQDMVMSRLRRPSWHQDLCRRLHGVFEGSSAAAARHLDDTMRRRLGPARTTSVRGDETNTSDTERGTGHEDL